MDLFPKGTKVNLIAMRAESASVAGSCYDHLVECMASDNFLDATVLGNGRYLKVLKVELKTLEGTKYYADSQLYFAPPPIFEVHVTGEIV